MSTLTVSYCNTKHPSVVPPDEMIAWYQPVFQGLTVDERIEQRYRNPAGWIDRDPLSWPTFHSTIISAGRTALRRAAHYDVWCGMARRRPGRRGRKEDCVATGVLHAEFDLKDFGGGAAALLRRLETFGLPLSIIVFSGAGFHVQVLLSDIVDLSLPETKDRLEAVNRHLAHAIAGGVEVDNVADVSRILRVPGTMNFKYDPPRQVTLERAERDWRYTLEEVDTYLRRRHPLPEPAPHPRRSSTAGGSTATSPTSPHDALTPWDDWLAQAPSWPQMLEADGWTLCSERGDVQYWTRPGKDARDGLSASVGKAGPDVLHVFSSSVQGLRQNGNYDRWAYEVAMRHDGDFRAAARAKAQEGYGTLGRYAKEHHGGDLQAAAKDLARQKYEAEAEQRQGGRHVLATPTREAGTPLRPPERVQGTPLAPPSYAPGLRRGEVQP